MLDIDKIAQACAVAVCSLLVSVIACLNVNNNVAPAVASSNIDTELNTESDTDAEVESEEDNTSLLSQNNLTAGVSADLEYYLESNYLENSGLTTNILSQSIVGIGPNSITEPVAEEDYGYTNIGIANITTGNLNIREEASSDSKVVGKMTAHNACEILDEEDGWYKIRSGNVEGYVGCEYIITGDEANDLAASEASIIARVINTTSIRIKSEPSTDANTIQIIGQGEEMHVLEILDGWYKVEADDGKEGYVSAEYIEIAKKLSVALEYSDVKNIKNVSDRRAELVEYACQFVGNRYSIGGTSLTDGIDCSGFTMQIFKKFDVTLPHYSEAQPDYGKMIDAENARPGDLFFYGNEEIDHVAIYIGNGKIVHAEGKHSGITISNAYYRTPMCVVSYLP